MRFLLLLCLVLVAAVLITEARPRRRWGRRSDSSSSESDSSESYSDERNWRGRRARSNRRACLRDLGFHALTQLDDNCEPNNIECWIMKHVAYRLLARRGRVAAECKERFQNKICNKPPKWLKRKLDRYPMLNDIFYTWCG